MIERMPVVSLGDQPIYSFQPKQLEAFRLTPVWDSAEGTVHLGYGGSAGSGKSYAARGIALAVASRWPGSTSIIFRKTEAEVLENHYQKFRTELPLTMQHEGRQVPFYTWNGEERSFTFPQSKNSRILLGFLRHADDIYKYQGNEYDLIIFEEATHYPWASVSWLINNRLRATVPGSLPFVFYPTNPGNVGHFWFNRVFVRRDFRDEERPNEYAFVQAKLADNRVLMERDPSYARKLDQLQEPYRSWYRDGLWTAGVGSGLAMLNRRVHLIPPFEVPSHWLRFGAFDWGFNHPFAFGEYAVSEDGDLFKLQSITGRFLLPHEIAQRITAHVDPKRLKYIAAGLDAFHVLKARGENTPTIAESLGKHGLHLSPANTDRIPGWNNLRSFLAWQNIGPGATEGEPGLRFFDNPGNQTCLDQLEAMVSDPDDPEDVLKVNADEHGEGGDDYADETRYACASRPSRAPNLHQDAPVQAFSKAALAYDVERLYKRTDLRPRLAKRGMPPLHSEFGSSY
jgi:terminase large subunit-like protein